MEQEMKFRVPSLADVAARLRAAGAVMHAAAALEDNWVLDSADRTLASSGRLLRVRRWGGACVVTTKGPAAFAGGVKSREEHEAVVADAGDALTVFAALGFEPVRRYQKRREVWRLAGVEVALDETPMGAFVEVEGEAARLPAAARSLGLDPSNALAGTYLELWRRHRESHPEAPEDMVFP